MKKTELSMIKCCLPWRARTSNLQLSSVTPLKLLQKRKIGHQTCAFRFRLSALRLSKRKVSEQVTLHTGKNTISENRGATEQRTVQMDDKVSRAALLGISAFLWQQRPIVKGVTL